MCLVFIDKGRLVLKFTESKRHGLNLVNPHNCSQDFKFLVNEVKTEETFVVQSKHVWTRLFLMYDLECRFCLLSKLSLLDDF
jgi:hypothetical protein